MPIEYAIKNDCKVLVVLATDVITVLERAALVQQIISDPSLPESIPVLIDVSGVINIPEIAEIPKLAFLAEQIVARFKSKVAYFVVQPGMVTPYHLVALSVSGSGSAVSVFSNKSDAYDWLASQ